MLSSWRLLRYSIDLLVIAKGQSPVGMLIHDCKLLGQSPAHLLARFCSSVTGPMEWWALPPNFIVNALAIDNE